jgi:hypothetical protein
MRANAVKSSNLGPHATFSTDGFAKNFLAMLELKSSILKI